MKQTFFRLFPGLALAMFLAACGKSSTADTVQPAISGSTELDTLEIKVSGGEQLSSWRDFRENSISGPQQVKIGDYHLEVGGLVGQARKYTYEDLLSRQSYSQVLKLNCVEGWTVNILWEGFLLKDLLDEAGVDSSAKTVIFRCYDGYSTSQPLSFVLSHDLILALKMNGETLHPERGYPLVFVAGSKWGYKWAKWITGIELSGDPNYRGFWERYGYSIIGDLKNSPYD